MRLPFATLLLSTAAITLTAAPARVAPHQVNTAGRQDSGPVAVAARIARVEQGLLPGIIISGRPLPTTTLSERMAALKTPGVSIAVIKRRRHRMGEGLWRDGNRNVRGGDAPDALPGGVDQQAGRGAGGAAAGGTGRARAGRTS